MVGYNTMYGIYSIAHCMFLKSVRTRVWAGSSNRKLKIMTAVGVHSLTVSCMHYQVGTQGTRQRWQSFDKGLFPVVGVKH